ncbi:MAG: ABC transporter permease [Beijerinckiaceae bacterium]
MSSAPKELPHWVDVVLVPAASVATAFVAAGLVVLAIGENPLEALQILLRGALGSGEGVGFTLYYATNFIFTGLAVAVAFHAGLFNIGGEGQAYLGGLGAALIALAFDSSLPAIILLPLAVIASAAFGALWAFVPAWLQAKRDSHIVITTIMFNFLAATLMVYLLAGPLKPLGSMAPDTRGFTAAAQLPTIKGVLVLFGATIPSSPLNLTFFLALLAAAFVWLLIWRSRLGYEIRAFGHNPAAAAYAGISATRITIITLLISGALAGLMASNEILGVHHRLSLGFVSGYGFVGIAVALMGRSHPVGVVLASLLFGVLYQGGAELAFEKPAITRDMIVVIQGLVILFAGALERQFRAPLTALFGRRPSRAETQAATS